MMQFFQSLYTQLQSSLQLRLIWNDYATWLVLIDILLVFYIIYQGLLLLKGTKAVPKTFPKAIPKALLKQARFLSLFREVP